MCSRVVRRCLGGASEPGTQRPIRVAAHASLRVQVHLDRVPRETVPDACTPSTTQSERDVASSSSSSVSLSAQSLAQLAASHTAASTSVSRAAHHGRPSLHAGTRPRSPHLSPRLRPGSPRGLPPPRTALGRKALQPPLELASSSRLFRPSHRPSLPLCAPHLADELPPLQRPYVLVGLESEDHARKLTGRMVSAKNCWEYWAHAPTYADLHAKVKSDPVRALWVRPVSSPAFSLERAPLTHIFHPTGTLRARPLRLVALLRLGPPAHAPARPADRHRQHLLVHALPGPDQPPHARPRGRRL